MIMGAVGFGNARLRPYLRIPLGNNYVARARMTGRDAEDLITIDAEAMYTHLIDMINQGQLGTNLWNIPPDLEAILTQGRMLRNVDHNTFCAINTVIRGYLERLKYLYIRANHRIQGDGAYTADYYPNIPFGLVMNRQERTPLQFMVNELTNHALNEINLYYQHGFAVTAPGAAAVPAMVFTEEGRVVLGDLHLPVEYQAQGTRADGWH